ncbi:MAG: hypothetical protein IJ858_04025 [Acidaminococcaceae bacterium]|nr:hypothetical protein [Acidaminococcaceae bacterium]
MLNVQNGTLNLATGELQPHDRKNLLTKICSASYEEQPASPLWEETVSTILPDPRCPPLDAEIHGLLPHRQHGRREVSHCLRPRRLRQGHLL